MKTDLLNTFSSELRKMPYDVPEGYFDTLKKDLRKSSAVRIEKGIWSRVVPYASVAAVFIALVTAGMLLTRSSFGEDEMTFEDYLVHSGSMINEEYPDEIRIIDNEINEEDIIEYLIYTGVTAELIENSK